MKAAYTNQCIAPIQCHWSIRVCSIDSLSSVTVRRPGLSLRLIGVPTRTVPTMERTARTVIATATAVNARDTTMAKVCMRTCSSGSVGARLPARLREPRPRGRRRQASVGVRCSLPGGNCLRREPAPARPAPHVRRTPRRLPRLVKVAVISTSAPPCVAQKPKVRPSRV
jgi:hypothetical protein